MKFTSSFLDTIKSRILVSEIVGKKVKLRRRGREFIGLSPFKQEKTPSFTVNDDKGFYHCFSSGFHGDIFTFLMETEGFSFPEAVRILANQAGVKIPEVFEVNEKQSGDLENLRKILNVAFNWFQDQLRDPNASHAKKYLLERGITLKTIEYFHIGFAPDQINALTSYLISKDFSEDLIIKAGLGVKNESRGKIIDRFRGRIIFPIIDSRDRVIAFGGRTVFGRDPKYLNSPETILFEKRKTLYGLFQARQSIYKSNQIIVVEGYLDVISLHQAGLSNVVSSLGTALTEDHLLQIWKYAAEPIICLDGDSSGRDAMCRVADKAFPLLKPGKSLSFASIPDGDDPDSYIKNKGLNEFKLILERAMSLSEFIWNVESSVQRLDTPERRAYFESRLLEKTRLIVDSKVRREYEDFFKKMIWEKFRMFKKQTSGKALPFSSTKQDSFVANQKKTDPLLMLQKILLLLMINHPFVLEDQENAEDQRSVDNLAKLDFSSKKLEKIRREILSLVGKNDLSMERIMQHLESRNLKNEIKLISTQEIIVHALFTKPGAKKQEVFLGLKGILNRYHSLTLKQERKEAGKVFSKTGKAEDAGRLVSLRKQEIELDSAR